ncbi:unnamed protein product [Parnassius apollo]|uniref:(apollo) hypothetical protein n=1 Tax=Parnassius apollo TaxID=110799 RepID=A0A8S3X4X8_PARAO|nr:unnamed protein product [Parnassius apollo]
MRIIILFVLTCVFNGALCAKLPCNECRSAMKNVRIKRAKYYSSPQRFYKRPPMGHPVYGAFSYTPPPGYMMDDEEQIPSSQRPTKFSKRPSDDGLKQEDLKNLIKYLSKKDLDKIVEFAMEKEKYRDTYFEKTRDFKKQVHTNNEGNFKDANDEKRFSLDGPYINPNGYKHSNMEFQNSNIKYTPQPKPIRESESDLENRAEAVKMYFTSPSEPQETIQNQQFAVVDAFIQQEFNGMGNERSQNIFTDSKVMEEEYLPTPLNLRPEDYDASFTNNIPTFIKADSSSYKLENFGSLPLMNYNSKLHSVSSYSVPHYTVTSPTGYQTPPEPPQLSSSHSSSDVESPPLELAPATTNYRDQTDAHLKAIKIWTHKSRGTAYTLHDDGTLSLEKPLRPKPKYG